jgi:cell wall-associated NlpC family hydrolase
MSFTACRRTAAIVMGLACGVAMTMGQPAGARPRPSADDVSKARAKVRDRGAELGRTAAQLASAKARLDELSASAERGVEAYNASLVRLAEAQSDYQGAMRRAGEADLRVETARRAVVAIATESYGGYDPGMTAMMAGSGGVEGYLYRTSMLRQLGGGQARILRELRDAQQVAEIMRDQAGEAYADQQTALEQAESAKVAAEAAVHEQMIETGRLEREKAGLEKRLDQARSRADRLARERAADLERRRLRYRPAHWKAVGAEAQRGDVAASWALTQLGKPYVWAAAGPRSYDCSGLTMRAWEHAGVALDHWTGTQWRSGPHVPVSSLRRGDLVFFGHVSGDPGTIHHVGIFIGQGMMVHAPQTGDVVRVSPIWRHDLVGATRPTG